jgi:hypothetical protein
MSCLEQSSLFFLSATNLVIFHPTLSGRRKSACALIFAEDGKSFKSSDKALCYDADEEEIPIQIWVWEG